MLEIRDQQKDTVEIMVVGEGSLGERIVKRIGEGGFINTKSLALDEYQRLDGERSGRHEIASDADKAIFIAILGANENNDELSRLARTYKEKGTFVIAAMINQSEGNEYREPRKLLDEQIADSVIVIYDNIKSDDETLDSVERASAEDVLYNTISTIISLLNTPSVINLDYDDIVQMMDGSVVEADTGFGVGDFKGRDAVTKAFASRFHGPGFESASRFIMVISGDITLLDASNANDFIRRNAGPEIDIVFGASYSEDKIDGCSVTILACS